MNFCTANIASTFTQNLIYIVLGILLIVLFIILIKAFKYIRKFYKRIIFLIIFIPIYFLISAIISFFTLLSINSNIPLSYSYSILNAAIKNTCFLDPQRIHCPTTSQEIIAIQPQDFIDLTKNVNLTYQYYSQNNQYTLIVRDGDNAVIFDPRLVNLKDYNYGFDFADVLAESNCDGTFRIINPPPFSGPWNKVN